MGTDLSADFLINGSLIVIGSNAYQSSSCTETSPSNVKNQLIARKKQLTYGKNRIVRLWNRNE